MGSGRSLSSEERAVVIALSKTKMSQRAIAAHLNRSKTAIQHVLRDNTTVKSSSKVGRPSKVSPTFTRLILRTAKKDKLSASQLVNKLGIDVSVRTVQRILQNDYFTEYVTMKARPNLSPVHRQKRLKWAREMVVKCASFWRTVTFTDEKRWCLDGPDGYSNYWADTRLPREVFSKRVNGGGGIMVWAGVSWRGKTELAFVSNKIDAVQYCRMLDDYYQPYVEKFYPAGNVF